MVDQMNKDSAKAKCNEGRLDGKNGKEPTAEMRWVREMTTSAEIPTVAGYHGTGLQRGG